MQDPKHHEPQWLAYEDCRPVVTSLLTRALGARLSDVSGVISQYGWEPDWPVVLHFSSHSVRVQTKCDYLWAIDSWAMGDPLYESGHDDGPLHLTVESLVPLLGLQPLLGCKLQGIYWPASRGYDVEQQFLLAFGGASLKVYDAGDQLGLQYLTNDRTHALSAFWERLL